MIMAWSVDRLGRSLQDLVAFLSDVHSRAPVDSFVARDIAYAERPDGEIGAWRLHDRQIGVFRKGRVFTDRKGVEAVLPDRGVDVGRQTPFLDFVLRRLFEPRHEQWPGGDDRVLPFAVGGEAVQVSKLLLVLRQSKVPLVGGGKALDRNRPDNVPEPLLKIGDRLVLRRLDCAFARL